MKRNIFLICLFVIMAAGCQTSKPVIVPEQMLQSMAAQKPKESCPMPSGFQLGPAAAMAERTLLTCPNKFEQVFMRLLDISKHRPESQNAVIMQNLVKKLVNKNMVSERYGKELYQKYFSTRFVSLPDMRTYNLRDSIGSIKKEMNDELRFKRIGMIECCRDRDRYRKAEGEYARLINFLENLQLNEEYMRNGNTY